MKVQLSYSVESKSYPNSPTCCCVAGATVPPLGYRNAASIRHTWPEARAEALSKLMEVLAASVPEKEEIEWPEATPSF